MFHSRLIKLFIFVLITSTAVFGNQKGWWEKILPSKEPEVLKSESKTLVTPDPQVVSLQDSFAKVAEAVKPAVVNISAVQITKVSQDPEFYYGDPNEFFYRFFHGDGLPQQRPREREQRQEGTGSGLLLIKKGIFSPITMWFKGPINSPLP
ncbi:MAG: hypothetical protein ACKVQC_04720 [Elusimicrobiota bacterium]